VYVAIGPLPSAPPGREMNAFSAAELEAARNLDWLTGPRTHGRYQVAVSGDGKAAALCAESDIDGDGVRAVHVAFLPSEQGEAPPAPCTEPVPDDGRAQPGEVVQLTGNGVF
jgi:hypothetical protein